MNRGYAKPPKDVPKFKPCPSCGNARLSRYSATDGGLTCSVRPVDGQGYTSDGVYETFIHCPCGTTYKDIQ